MENTETTQAAEKTASGGIPFKILIGGLVFSTFYGLFLWLVDSMIRWGAIRSLMGLMMDWGESIGNGFMWNLQIIFAMVFLLIALIALVGASALGASLDDKSGKTVNLVQHGVNMLLVLSAAGGLFFIASDLFDCMRFFWWEGFWRTVNSMIFALAMFGTGLVALASVAIYGFSLYKKIKA